MSQRLQEIKRNLRQSRDHAYLGRYEEARKGFKKVLDVVEEAVMMNTIDKKYIDDWRKFESQILQEKRLVQSIISMLNGISFENKDKHNGFNDSWGQFDESRNTKYKFYDDQKRNNSNFKQTKYNQGDPDVWAPPPPQAQYPRPNNVIRNQSMQRRPAVNNQKANTAVVSNVNKGYDKPWLNNANSSTNTGNKIKKQGQAQNGEERRTFLLDRYPDGNGPDAHLIQMLQREVIETKLNITFNEIAELETAKSLLQQAVLLPLKMPEFFTGIRRAWRGVLMFGPPGTGKTLLAKAMASSGKTTFFNVSASSLASKWKGESQKLMARFYAPTILFFDEIDAIGGKRSDGQDQSNRKVKTELLVQMEGASNGDESQKKYVMVLAATNRPWDLDEALRRRLQKRIYIPLPNEKGRLELLKINLRDLKLAEDVNLDEIVKRTKGFSGADITNICREAAYMPMRKKLKQGGGFDNIENLECFQQEVNVPLTMEDFKQALKNVNKSVGDQDLEKYQKWMKEFGSV